MPLDQEITIVNMPKEGAFSLVQLILDGKPIMVCGHKEHREILADYLRSQKIKPELETRIEMFGEKEIPEKTGERYELIGAGMAQISVKQKRFLLPCQFSVHYNIGPNHEFREQLKKQFSDYKAETYVF